MDYIPGCEARVFHISSRAYNAWVHSGALEYCALSQMTGSGGSGDSGGRNNGTRAPRPIAEAKFSTVEKGIDKGAKFISKTEAGVEKSFTTLEDKDLTKIMSNGEKKIAKALTKEERALLGEMDGSTIFDESHSKSQPETWGQPFFFSGDDAHAQEKRG